MKARHRPSPTKKRAEMFERLRYFVFKARQGRKSLTLDEIDELCQIVVWLAPKKRHDQDPAGGED